MPALVSEMVQVHLFRRTAGRAEFLVLHRAESEPVYPGVWQVITGGIDQGERAADAARREVDEETGIRCDELIVLPYVASFFSLPRDAVHLVPVFAAEVPAGCAVRLSHEHQAFEWLPDHAAFDRLVFPSHRQGHRVLIDDVLSSRLPVVRDHAREAGSRGPT